MTKKFEEAIESLSEELTSLEKRLRIDALASFLTTADIVERFLDIAAKKEPISLAGFKVLHLLIRNKGIMTPSDISRKTWRSKHAVTKIIDTLEKQDFVERLQLEANDRRLRKVAITKEGLEYVKKSISSSKEGNSSQLLYSFDEKEIEQFVNNMLHLRKEALALIKDMTTRD